MAEKKMTRREAYTAAVEIIKEWKAEHFEPEDLAGAHTDDVIAVLEHSIAQLDKQASRPKSKTSARLQNEPMARDFIAQLQKINEPVNAKWMTEHVKFCLTSQKAVAIAKIAEEWGAIEKVSIKNRTYYVPVEGWVMPN